MRIAYGVMGYGRGHAMRARAVLPWLAQRHEVTVFAGGDAHEALAVDYPTVRIPVIGYRYGDDGTVSVARTLAGNAAPVADLLGNGPRSRRLDAEFRQRGIDLVISDSDTWTHRAARRRGIPRIGFDHVGVIAYCKPHFPPGLRTAGWRDARGYRAFMGEPDRILVSSFYPAEPKQGNTRVVGPILREEVLRARPTDGEHLLVYLNKGRQQYRASLDRTLRLLEIPVRIYGAGAHGQRDNLSFCALDRARFLDDLASCRGLLSTAGNVLAGEAIHLGKPILALPENVFEQRLNAAIIERLGIGRQSGFDTLTPSDVDRFLAEREGFRHNMVALRGDGRAEALATLEQYIGELGPRPAARRGRRPAPRSSGLRLQA